MHLGAVRTPSKVTKRGGAAWGRHDGGQHGHRVPGRCGTGTPAREAREAREGPQWVARVLALDDESAIARAVYESGGPLFATESCVMMTLVS